MNPEHWNSCTSRVEDPILFNKSKTFQTKHLHKFKKKSWTIRGHKLRNTRRRHSQPRPHRSAPTFEDQIQEYWPHPLGPAPRISCFFPRSIWGWVLQKNYRLFVMGEDGENKTETHILHWKFTWNWSISHFSLSLPCFTTTDSSTLFPPRQLHWLHCNRDPASSNQGGIRWFQCYRNPSRCELNGSWINILNKWLQGTKFLGLSREKKHLKSLVLLSFDLPTPLVHVNGLIGIAPTKEAVPARGTCLSASGGWEKMAIPKPIGILAISKTIPKNSMFSGEICICKTRFTHQSSRIFAKKWCCQRADLNSHIPSRNRELLPGVATGIEIYRTSASELELLEAFAKVWEKSGLFFWREGWFWGLQTRQGSWR